MLSGYAFWLLCVWLLLHQMKYSGDRRKAQEEKKHLLPHAVETDSFKIKNATANTLQVPWKEKSDSEETALMARKKSDQNARPDQGEKRTSTRTPRIPCTVWQRRKKEMNITFRRNGE
ncbi:hypothetical protein GW17_00004094 [Ensete ventricosum]|uniref:Uncharacterized protein n=1 Tax=Ensete ventricosum TaxID=4639 RepID=A0A444G8R6_ENSVE|nr:hypothetical protein GW17_00004094 [Ensete ventricosum]RZR72383.1 hypothetical protein BHM03_00013061 [Ensete ventricosum]